LNNVGQLGLAIHHYEYNREHLPPGVTNPTGPVLNQRTGQHISWIVRILPYMELKNIHANIDIDAGAYSPINSAASSVQILPILCPSSPDADTTSQQNSTSALTSYAGSYHDVEAPIDSDNDGLLFLNSKVRYSDIPDGSSNTILIGEKLAFSDDLGWMSGTRSTLRNTGDFAIPNPKRRGSATSGIEIPTDQNGGFGSHHYSGANFGFADGSIRFLSRSIDRNLFQNLGNRHDGAMLGGVFEE